MPDKNYHLYFKDQKNQDLKAKHPVTYMDLSDGLKWVLGSAGEPGKMKTLKKLSLHSITFNEGYNSKNVFKLVIAFTQGLGSETLDIPRTTTVGASGTENVLFFKKNDGKPEIEIEIPNGTKDILYELVNTGNVVFDATLTIKYE